MTDKNETTRAIIERAMSDLIALGFTREGAATLLAVQGIVRMDDPEQLAGVAMLARETAEAFAVGESLH